MVGVFGGNTVKGCRTARIGCGGSNSEVDIGVLAVVVSVLVAMITLLVMVVVVVVVV